MDPKDEVLSMADNLKNWNLQEHDSLKLQIHAAIYSGSYILQIITGIRIMFYLDFSLAKLNYLVMLQ